MALRNGQRLGHYEVLSPIGTGGMGEVYKGRDVRFGRIVAVKILRPDLNLDADHRRRFEREARMISRLNHPNICTLYDAGSENGVDFLVMEYVEGESLADRLSKGRLPLRQALHYAIEIARALDCAHRQNVVHRDLKPGNIVLGESGAKLLDFGLATLKPAILVDVSEDLSSASTEFLESTITAEGLRIGTPIYMSPEQIEGKRLDARTDVFSFGVILYELLTGQRPFQGQSSTAVMGAILNLEPLPVSRLDPGLPHSLDALVQHCLTKAPNDRWHSMHDVLLELESIEADQEPTIELKTSRPLLGRLGWGLSLISIAVVAWALITLSQRQSRTAEKVTRFTVAAPQGFRYHEPFWSHPAVSPDGRFLAFVATSLGQYHLCLRPLDASTAQQLPGTAGALAPFWSPDSRTIAFFADRKLKLLSVEGGSVQSLCDVPGASASGTWGNGAILFAVREASGEEGLYTVKPSSAGTPSKLQIEDPSLGNVSRTAFFPQFLPDGRRFIFPSWHPKQRGVYIGSLDSPTASPLVPGAAFRMEYAPPGYLMGVSDRTLVARPFDLDKLTFRGDPIPIAENVSNFGNAGVFSVSTNGVLAYGREGVKTSKLSWFDTTGRYLGSLGEAANHNYVRISPDGQRCVVTIQDSQTEIGDLWMYQLPQGTATRLLPDAVDKLAPIWSPDAQQLAFSSSRDGPPHLFSVRLKDLAISEIVPRDGHFQRACDWHPNGRDILFTERSSDTSYDLWKISVGRGGAPIPVVQTRFVEAHGSFSLDGRWLAYDSNESGGFEVYVQSYPDPVQKLRVSPSGGLQPRWLSNNELIYMGSDSEILAISFDDTSPPSIGQPHRLLQINEGYIRDYDVSRDGRLLINLDDNSMSEYRVQVMLNWPAEITAPESIRK